MVWLVLGGFGLLVVGSALGGATAARAGAAGIATGSLLVAAQYVRIYARR